MSIWSTCRTIHMASQPYWRTSGRRTSRKKAIASVKARLGDERTCKLGLSMAIRMLASDGVLRTSEREFILDLADTLGVDRAAAADLVKEIAG